MGLALSILIVVASHLAAPLTGASPSEQGAPPAVTLQQVVGGLSQPLYVTHAGDGSGRLFVVEKAGKIKIVINGQVQATPFLDIDPLVHSADSEQGLLGLAFHPSYQTNGRFYVFYTDEANQNDILSRYQRAGADPTRADPASGRVLLDIPDPYSNHNGGMLEFGPDGYLYVGTGDGGFAGDPGNRAQNLQELLGKLLRLNVDLAADVAPYYEIPPSNPYATRTDGSRREIWAYGLRNPWRFSFDRQTGDLWIGDVGQGAREEINRQTAGSGGGQNYGWRIMEGLSCFSPSSGCNQSGLTLPIQDYDHSLGCSVTGGYVYRGAAVPDLRGHYIFGDYCSGRIWSLRLQDGNWVRTELLDTGYAISSFGEDEAGELYLTDLSGGSVYRFTSAEACVVNTLAASTASADSGRRGRLDPAPFRRLRDDVLKRSGGGQRYVRLYETHSPEIVRLMASDPGLRTALRDGLLLWQADLGALADGRSGSATIDAEQVRAAEAVLDRLAAKGSPGLRRAIEQERRAHPPATFVGKPLDRALDELTRGQPERDR
jgi:glucose/arabinose dehydrogenase